MKSKVYLYGLTSLILSSTSIQGEIGQLQKNLNEPKQNTNEAVDCSYVDRFLGGTGNTKERVDALRTLLGGNAPYATDKAKYLQKLIHPESDLYTGIVTLNKYLGNAGGANTSVSKVVQIQNLINPGNDLSKAIIEINKLFGQMGGANNFFAKVEFINNKLGSPGYSTVNKLTQITNLIGAGHAPGNRAEVGPNIYDKLKNLLNRLKAHDVRTKNAKTLEEVVTILESPPAPSRKAATPTHKTH